LDQPSGMRERVRAGPSFQLGTLSTRIANLYVRLSVYMRLYFVVLSIGRELVANSMHDAT